MKIQIETQEAINLFSALAEYRVKNFNLVDKINKLETENKMLLKHIKYDTKPEEE